MFCPRLKAQNVLFRNEPFLCTMLVSFFSSNISLYIEENLVEKLCKVLKMELKTYTPVSPKFVFEEIEFKILHYIQHDFICHRLGLTKDQTSSKVLLLRPWYTENFFQKMSFKQVGSEILTNFNIFLVLSDWFYL